MKMRRFPAREKFLTGITSHMMLELPRWPINAKERRKMSARIVWRCALMGCLIYVTGCGGGDPGYHVSGKVTFNGQPIPEGKIYFSPDNSKGNKGHTGYANIVDGAYNTATPEGKKQLGGPMIVKIEGFDPNENGPASEETTIKSLFPPYEMFADLQKAKSSKDFDVPAAAADVKVESEKKGEGGAVVP